MSYPNLKDLTKQDPKIKLNTMECHLKGQIIQKTITNNYIWINEMPKKTIRGKATYKGKKQRIEKKQEKKVMIWK
jgi:hypothetical protein